MSDGAIGSTVVSVTDVRVLRSDLLKVMGSTVVVILTAVSVPSPQRITVGRELGGDDDLGAGVRAVEDADDAAD